MPYSTSDLDPNLVTHKGRSVPSSSSDPVRSPVLTILAHPDPGRVGERTVLEGLARGERPALSRLETVFHGPGSERPALPLADGQLSRAAIHFEGLGDGSIRLHVPVDRTTLHVGQQRAARETIVDAKRLEEGEVLLLAGRVTLLLRRTKVPAWPDLGTSLLGTSAEMADLRTDLERAARTDLPALLLGESGTGKELAARALHQHRARNRGGRFVPVHLAALPSGLVAAELFGVSKGAFTGAETREGCFVRAHGGTLFIDEVGELPVEVQVQLLRVLEERKIRRLGDGRSFDVDVRVVSATDAALARAVDENRFRRPLYQRLKGYEIRLPPLRRRREDIGLLFHHFLRQELSRHGAVHKLDPVGADRDPFVPAALVARLARYAWPGNVRELRNLAARLAGAGFDQPRLDLPPELLAPTSPARSPTPNPASGPAVQPKAPEPQKRQPYRDPTSVTDEELIAAIEAEDWNYQKAADRLGLSKGAFYRLVERCPQIRTAADLGEAELKAAHAKHGGRLAAMASELRAPKKGIRQRMTELGIG